MKYLFLFIFIYNAQILTAQIYFGLSSGINFSQLELSPKSAKNGYIRPFNKGLDKHLQFDFGHKMNYFGYGISIIRQSITTGYKLKVPTDCQFCDGGQSMGYRYNFHWAFAANIFFPIPIKKEKLYLSPYLTGLYRLKAHQSKGPYTYANTEYVILSEIEAIKNSQLNFNVQYGLELTFRPWRRHAFIFKAAHNIGLQVQETTPYYLYVKKEAKEYYYYIQQKGSYVGIYLGYCYYWIGKDVKKTGGKC